MIVTDHDVMPSPTAAEVPHLLEWYASYCITLSESCTDTRTKRLLRLLSSDLALESLKLRGAGRHQTARVANPSHDLQMHPRPTEHAG